MEMNKGINPFLNKIIIEHLASPKINGDAELRSLRQLSQLYHQILNTKYFDKVQLAITINKRYGRIVYGPRPGPGPDTPEEAKHYMMPLKHEIWDPIAFAPTIRKLILTGTKLDYVSPSSTTIIGEFNPLELISQISPHITTLALDLTSRNSFGDKAMSNFPEFLQQFTSLRMLKLQIKYWRLSDLDQLETLLIKIDNEVSGEFEIELELGISPTYYHDHGIIEIILSPARKFITINHKFSLNIPYHLKLSSVDKRMPKLIQAEYWAKILTFTKDNSIPFRNIRFHIFLHEFDDEEKRNQLLDDLPIISPYVEKLCLRGTSEYLLFTSCNWPRLKELYLDGRNVQLIGLSSICPTLEELDLSVIESESLFTNTELTDEENLYQIFANCANTLKRLRFKQDKQYFYSDEIPKIIPGSKLLGYLQELLPKTLVEAEGFETV